MRGSKQQRRGQLFRTGFSLDARVGEDNRFRRIANVPDFSFVRPAGADRHGDVGNPSIDPTVVQKLMLISFLENIPSERELMRRMPGWATGPSFPHKARPESGNPGNPAGQSALDWA